MPEIGSNEAAEATARFFDVVEAMLSSADSAFRSAALTEVTALVEDYCEFRVSAGPLLAAWMDEFAQGG